MQKEHRCCLESRVPGRAGCRRKAWLEKTWKAGSGAQSKCLNRGVTSSGHDSRKIIWGQQEGGIWEG